MKKKRATSRLFNKSSFGTWSFIGVVIAVAFGSIGIYSIFIRESKPDITYQVLGINRIFELKEDVAELDILYDGKSIKQTGQMLSVITFKVQNKGSVGIVETSYAKEFPLGARVNSGTIVAGPHVIESNQEYLSAFVDITVHYPRTFSFSPIILDPGAFFVVKFLVLHDEGRELSIESIGKVANVETIAVTNDTAGEDRQGFSSVLYTISVRDLLSILAIVVGLIIMAWGLIGMYIERHRVESAHATSDYYEKMLESIIEVYVGREAKDKGANTAKQHLGRDSKSE